MIRWDEKALRHGFLTVYDFLYELHWKKNWSGDAIGQLVGCNRTTVYKALKKYGVPRKTRGRGVRKGNTQLEQWLARTQSDTSQMTPREIAAAAGYLTVSCVFKLLKSRKIPYKKTLERMYSWNFMPRKKRIELEKEGKL